MGPRMGVHVGGEGAVGWWVGVRPRGTGVR